LAGEPAAEDIDVWHRHGHHSPAWNLFIAAVMLACRVLSLKRFCLKSLAVGVGHEGAHVVVDRDSGPMPGKDPLAELVLLAEPHSSHTRPLEAEVEPSDASEK
jgi:hypothetical protein